MIKELNNYIQNIKSGKILSGSEIKQAVERFEKDLLRDDIYFDEEKALKAIKFIGHLKHFTGKFNDKNFILSNWQFFIICNIFGWTWTKNGNRRFTGSYIEVARKNGKTALASAISLYMLIAEGEPNAEIIIAANSREQAKICFDSCAKFGRKLDPKGQYIKSYRNDVKYQDNIIKVIASDSSKIDGLNPNLVIYDEYHASKTSELSDVLRSGQGMRESPLYITITTAGFDKKSPCYELRKTAKEILEGLKIDDTQFIAIYNLDDSDIWTDEQNWIKSNPNMDITIKSSFLKDEVNKAINNISLETGVKTKNLNLWCETIKTWISEKYVLSSSKDISFDLVEKEEQEVYVGVDLSSTTDITSVSYMFIDQKGKYNFINKYYLPEDSLNTSQDKEYYKIQHRKGNITLTSGNVVDYSYILNEILEIRKNYFIVNVAYDSWSSTQFAISATEQQLHLEPYSQTIANFNRPTKEFERLILQGNIIIQNNEITRWMLSNVHLRTDANGNVKPDKSKANKKIDGVISMLMCLGTWLNTPHYNITII